MVIRIVGADWAEPCVCVCVCAQVGCVCVCMCVCCAQVGGFGLGCVRVRVGRVEVCSDELGRAGLPELG